MRTILMPETNEEWLEASIKTAKEAEEEMNDEIATGGFVSTSTWHKYYDAIKQIGFYYYAILKTQSIVPDFIKEGATK